MGDHARTPYRTPVSASAPKLPAQSGKKPASHANRQHNMDSPASTSSIRSVESTPRAASYLAAQPQQSYGVYPQVNVGSHPAPYNLPSPGQAQIPGVPPQFSPHFGYAPPKPHYAQSPSPSYPASMQHAQSEHQQQRPQQLQPPPGVSNLPPPYGYQPQQPYNVPGAYYPPKFHHQSPSHIYHQQAPSHQYAAHPGAQFQKQKIQSTAPQFQSPSEAANFQKPGEVQKIGSPSFRPGLNAPVAPHQQNDTQRLGSQPMNLAPYGGPQYVQAPTPFQPPPYQVRPQYQCSPQYGQLPHFQQQPMQPKQTHPQHQSPCHQLGSPYQGHQPGSQSPPVYSPIALSPMNPHQDPKKQKPPSRPFLPPLADTKASEPAPNAVETAIDTVSTMSSLSGAALMGTGNLTPVPCKPGSEPSAPPLTFDGGSYFGEPEEYDALPAAMQTIPEDEKNLKLSQTRPARRQLYTNLKQSATRGVELVSEDEAAS